MDSARENRAAIYLGASAIAEFFADIALCPLEATRIRLVSQPSFASGLLPGFARIAREEGIGGFYAGFGPILFKQVPYTMAKFAVFEVAQEKIIAATGKTKDQLAGGQLTAVNLGGGLLAGFAAAIVSSRLAQGRDTADANDLSRFYRSLNPPTPCSPRSTRPRESPVRELPRGLSPSPSNWVPLVSSPVWVPGCS